MKSELDKDLINQFWGLHEQINSQRSDISTLKKEKALLSQQWDEVYEELLLYKSDCKKS